MVLGGCAFRLGQVRTVFLDNLSQKFLRASAAHANSSKQCDVVVCHLFGCVPRIRGMVQIRNPWGPGERECLPQCPRVTARAWGHVQSIPEMSNLTAWNGKPWADSSKLWDTYPHPASAGRVTGRDVKGQNDTEYVLTGVQPG